MSGKTASKSTPAMKMPITSRVAKQSAIRQLTDLVKEKAKEAVHANTYVEVKVTPVELVR